MRVLAWIGRLFGAAVLVAAVVFGGWQLGWWFNVQNNNRTAQMYQHGYAAQSGLISALSNDRQTITTITVQMESATGQELADLKSQRLQVANDACLKASQITLTLDPDTQAWVAANCSGSTVSLTSPLR